MSLRIDFVEMDRRWRRVKSTRRLARQVVAETVQAAGVSLLPHAEVTIHLINNSTIQGLNKTWRHKDCATNVLSFPASPAYTISKTHLLGDIFLALETLLDEAKTQHKLPYEHYAHLVAHGFLHLIGFDHQTPAEANIMEAIEIQVLQRLGMDDPYAGLELET